MSISLLAGVLALAVAAGPADAVQASSDAAPKAEVVAKKDKVKCRSVRVTGTRMPQRVCGTQQDWERRQEAAKKHTEKLQEGDLWRQGTGGPAPG